MYDIFDYRFYAETYLTIRDKGARMRPFLFNGAQEKYYSEMTNRDIKAKARQLGMSTFTQGRFYHKAATEENIRGRTIAHETKAAEDLFEMSRTFWEESPPGDRPRRKTDSRSHIEFPDMNSRLRIGSAKGKGIGRGGTNNVLHCSEMAYWDVDDDAIAGLFETVPMDGIIVVESTGRGSAGKFHEMCRRGEEVAKSGKFYPMEFKLHFFPWWIDLEYRIPLDETLKSEVLRTLTDEEKHLVGAYGLDLEQIAWRRWKVSLLREKFPQEYPERLDDCFSYYQGRIFRRLDEEVHVIDPFPIPRGWKKIVMIDPGIDHPFCALWMAVDGYDTAVIYREYYEVNEYVDYHAKQILKLNGDEKVDYYVIDPSASSRNVGHPQSVMKQLRLHGIRPIREADNAFEAGVDLVNEYLLCRADRTPPAMLYFFATCRRVIDEMKAQQWDPKHPGKAKEGIADEGPDCVRYGVMSLPYGRRMRDLRKAA